MGRWTQVSQAGDVTSGAVNFTVTVRMTDADPDVKPGMTAAVNIIVKQVSDQLLVPNRAVRFVDGQRVVYVLKDGKPVETKIVLGRLLGHDECFGERRPERGRSPDLESTKPGGGPFGPGGGG